MPSAAPMNASSSDSPSTMRSTRPDEKPSVFITPTSLVRSRTASAMVVPTISRMATNAEPTTSVTTKRDIAELRGEGLVEGRFVLGRGFVLRIGEALIDGVGDPLVQRSAEVVRNGIQPMRSRPKVMVSLK